MCFNCLIFKKYLLTFSTFWLQNTYNTILKINGCYVFYKHTYRMVWDFCLIKVWLDLQRRFLNMFTISFMEANGGILSRSKNITQHNVDKCIFLKCCPLSHVVHYFYKMISVHFKLNPFHISFIYYWETLYFNLDWTN